MFYLHIIYVSSEMFILIYSAVLSYITDRGNSVHKHCQSQPHSLNCMGRFSSFQRLVQVVKGFPKQKESFTLFFIILINLFFRFFITLIKQKESTCSKVSVSTKTKLRLNIYVQCGTRTILPAERIKFEAFGCVLED